LRRKSRLMAEKNRETRGLCVKGYF
jgi:hypothetical protein